MDPEEPSPSSTPTPSVPRIPARVAASGHGAKRRRGRGAGEPSDVRVPLSEPAPVLSGFEFVEVNGEDDERSSPIAPILARRLGLVLLLMSAIWAAGWPRAARADVVAAENERIADVTVYPDRAEVVREATLRLPAGKSTVEFRDIPPGIDADSLRVSGKGVGAVLGTVELGERVEEPETPAELAAATAEVERIRHELAALEAEESTANAMRDYLATVKTVTTDREREKLAEGKPDPAAIGAMFDLLRARLAELGREGVARRARREKLDKEMATAQQRFASARPAPPLRTRVAVVEVDATRAGSLTLRLSYFAPGASWRPTYRATLDASTGAVALVSEAVVRQTTGEDWTGVALHLSTAAPARGVRPPELTSWLLQAMQRADLPVKGRSYQNVLTSAPGVADPTVLGSRERDFESGVDPLTGTMMGNLMMDTIETVTVAGEAALIEPPPAPSVPASVSVVRSSYTVSFDVPGRAEVPADGHEHRVVLRSEDLPGSLEYRLLPSLQAAAYLIAITRAPEGYPLLAGTMRVFTADAFLGAYVLPETAPGAELRIPFGVDNRIRIERVALPREPGSENPRRDRKHLRGWRTTIENLADTHIDLVIEDRMPYSQDKGIEVETGKAMTAGFREVKDRPGIVEWSIPLAPREKREVVLDYTVTIDKEILVAGLS